MSIDIVYNNPYRVLGVYTNTSTKDIVNNVSKAKAYSKVGKSIELQADFNNFLPKINRTVGSITFAQSQINQAIDKITNALFWFNDEFPSDKIALGHLNAGNTIKAIDILEKRETYSSLVNRAVIAVCEKDIRNAIRCYSTLIHNYNYRVQFLHAVCGEKTRASEDEMLDILYDKLISIFPLEDFLNAFDATSNQSDYIRFRDIVVTKNLKVINTEIEIAKKADENVLSQFEAGIRLKNNTRSELAILKNLLGNDERFQLVSDKLANKILQFGIIYYNKSNDKNRARKAYSLMNYAYSIAVGVRTKERCKKNIIIIEEVIRTLPPDELTVVKSAIERILIRFSSRNKNVEEVLFLLQNCGPHLGKAKKIQGRDGALYRLLSSKVAETAISAIVDIVNNAIEKESSQYRLKLTLRDAWEVFLYLEVLDLENDAHERYVAERTAMEKKMAKYGVDTYSFSSDFKVETEQETFESCKTKADYEYFLYLFPNSEYKTVALKKIKEFEEKEKAEKKKKAEEPEEKKNIEKKQLLTAISRAKNYYDIIMLYPKCTDTDTKNALDDKCFELCETKSDYKQYARLFGNTAKHKDEAESHLKSDSKHKRLQSLSEKYKWWIVSLLAIFIVFIVTGVVWGPQGISVILWIICILSISVGYIFYNPDDEKLSFMVPIACFLIPFVSSMGALVLGNIEQSEPEYKEAENIYYENKPADSYRNSFLQIFCNPRFIEESLDSCYSEAVSNGLKSLDEFAKTNSNTTLGEKAAKRVAEVCDSLYLIAETLNTLQIWREYHDTVPQDRYADSEERIKALEPWETEDRAWIQAEKENSIMSYQKYLYLYPNGIHKDDAEKKVIDLQVEDVYAKEHGELPTMDQTGFGGGEISKISIYNNTSYTLKLLYSGPDSKKVVLFPKQKIDITLKNGTYRIAASVDASHVGNFAGNETLSGGSYNVEYYINNSIY